MTAPILHYANVPQVLTAYLSTLPGLGGVGIKMENTPPLPFILITQLPTGRQNNITSSADVHLEVFHSDPGLAVSFSRSVERKMLLLRHSVVMVDGYPVSIDHVTGTPFGYLDYQDPNLHRVLAEYSVDSRINAQPL